MDTRLVNDEEKKRKLEETKLSEDNLMKVSGGGEFDDVPRTEEYKYDDDVKIGFEKRGAVDRQPLFFRSKRIRGFC